MKLLLTLILVTSLNAYTISFDKVFEISIKPDTISTYITISTNNRSEKEVLKKLTSFSTYISGYKDIEKKGGNYTINPDYRYENNHRYKNGYNGTMNYQISSKHADDLNTFITNLHDKKRDFAVDISIASVSWVLTPAQKEGKLDQLRLKAIKWIKNYATALSSQVQSSCKVSKISLSQASFYQPRPVMMESKAMVSDAAPTPEQDDQKISISPHFELECS